MTYEAVFTIASLHHDRDSELDDDAAPTLSRIPSYRILWSSESCTRSWLSRPRIPTATTWSARASSYATPRWGSVDSTAPTTAS